MLHASSTCVVLLYTVLLLTCILSHGLVCVEAELIMMYEAGKKE